VSEEFDLIVIGAGSAARAGAARAHGDYGARIAMIERERWGGGCPNIACRPTKAYLVAAEQLHDVNAHAAARGILTGPATIDLAQLRRWKGSLRRTQDSWRELLSHDYATFAAEASFVDANTLRAGDRELTSERILVATGSRTAVPRIPGIDEVPWLDHVAALELDRVPEALLVVGAGPVGLELAQIFSRFGSRVTVVNHGSQIAARADAEAAAELRGALEAEGLEFVLEAGLEALRREDDVTVATVGGREVRVTDVLLASGRIPLTESLELGAAGVETDRGYVVVDKHQRTSADGVWAAGDVAIGPMFTPTAQYQARIAIDDMFADGARVADYSALPTSIFTDPELAAVGLTEQEARAEGFDVDVVKHKLKHVTRAQYTATKHGLYKIVFDRATRRVLGVHVVSRGGSDIVGGLAVALTLGATVDDLALVHHVYPSISEGVKAAAEKALPAPTRTPA
jgi:mercuric reductase